MRIFFALICVLILFGCSKNVNRTTEKTNTRIVGYLASSRFALKEKIAFEKLTHLNIAFANPNKDGVFEVAGIEELVAYARSRNDKLKICISIGGGAMRKIQADIWKELIDVPSNRPSLIDTLVAFVNKYGLDGVDVDIEWDQVTVGYSPFVLSLAAELHKENKLITAALPNNTLFKHISKEALAVYDFINIMSYDATGPWSPNKVKPHSSYDFAIRGIDFWKKHVKPEKLTLGVPFYGYDFTNTSDVKSVTYGNMVALDKGNVDADVVGKIFYNGRPTIIKKTKLGKKEVSGIMIWELGQDSFDDHSLLSIIYKIIHNSSTK